MQNKEINLKSWRHRKNHSCSHQPLLSITSHSYFYWK